MNMGIINHFYFNQFNKFDAINIPENVCSSGVGRGARGDSPPRAAHS